MKKLLTALFFIFYSIYAHSQSPRIVNIVNFIRLLEPRDAAITQDVLYQTVVNQIKLMRQYHLGGTFLLQYDALMDPRYQKLLKTLPRDSFEIGAWWEIPQPLVEHAGMVWRGRYPWDWRANIGFSTGYTPRERELLVDTYMKDFKQIFGYYPKSVASWFIDAHSLYYMYNHYHIVASANCKDQYGTDGYTLWGGYWNGAYYPSKLNAYMPAQHQANAIPVPVFRMLGSDPVRQYDDNLSRDRQGVITLEPVYPRAGGDSTWVRWFFNEFVSGANMAFSYAQAGQENSFTWDAMAKGLQIQFPLIERLRDEKKIRVETLAKSGAWFASQFKITPATAVTINHDLPGSNKKTVWFNSRFYRANLLWENGHLRFRDIHLFSEELPSRYETEVATTNDCEFYTLPLVDGYLWSDTTFFAGLRFKSLINGVEKDITGGIPTISDSVPGKLFISWPLQNVPGKLTVQFSEDAISMSLQGNDSFRWYLSFAAAAGKKLPFTGIASNRMNAMFEGMKYAVVAANGSFTKGKRPDEFTIQPAQQEVVLHFTTEAS
ncbi:hypothetical protein FC093_18670 [Ilyomonas limi]|uniref:Uncharacterized protein n=1 Tax=Ilyomonas limi TaxID=2575867 RepID=A0A4U3KY06_9BACT|nr:hypothetical protein [Ilyomonas limi]TKK66026.1 hypothetical protein FC093_18670 [Ilyomonas limi]